MKILYFCFFFLLLAINAHAIEVDFSAIPIPERETVKEKVLKIIGRGLRGASNPMIDITKLKIRECKKGYNNFTCTGTVTIPASSMDYTLPETVVENGIIKSSGLPAMPLTRDLLGNRLFLALSDLCDEIIITSPNGNFIVVGKGTTPERVYRFTTPKKRDLYLETSTGPGYMPIYGISYNKNAIPDNASREDRKRVYDFWGISP